MDKEMQAKIDEILKKQGRQQLNPDDLDKVVGGAKTCPDDYKYFGLTWEEAGSILQTLIDNFGEDVAIEFANTQWAKSEQWALFIRASSGSNAGYYAAGMIWGKAYEGGF